MKITMKKLLSELNKDLEWEYSAGHPVYAARLGDKTRAIRFHPERVADPRLGGNAALPSCCPTRSTFSAACPRWTWRSARFRRTACKCSKQDLKGERTPSSATRSASARPRSSRNMACGACWRTFLIQEEEHKPRSRQRAFEVAGVTTN